MLSRGYDGPVIACVDVGYRDGAGGGVTAACVCFAAWSDGTPVREFTRRYAEPAAAYVPGAFWKRELPYLLDMVGEVESRAGATLHAIIVDGYVWLEAGKPGLGAHLYDALNARVPVVGIAKTAFHGATSAREVRRGASTKPLFVTAAGIDVAVVADNVCSMHGTFRIPTLLARVDRLSRS